MKQLFHRHYSIVVMMLLPRSSTVRIVAATETVSRVLGARGSLYLELIAFEGLEKYMIYGINFLKSLFFGCHSNTDKLQRFPRVDKGHENGYVFLVVTFFFEEIFYYTLVLYDAESGKQ